MDTLLDQDRSLFVLLNQVWTHPLFDRVMPYVTDFDNWRIPIIAAVLFALVRGSKEVRVALLLAVLAVAATDQLACAIVKPIVHRPRPFKVVEGTRKLSGAHNVSFPSAHAANTAAAATFLTLRFPKVWPLLFVPVVVSYSRVYVGVHYPLDVVGGAGIGAAVGALVFAAERRFRRRGGGKRSTTEEGRT